MLHQKYLRNAFIISFVLYQLVSARLVSTDTTSQRKKPHLDPNPYETQDRRPRYWPRYSGSRNVRLLDGTWNAGFLESQKDGNIRFDSMDPDLDISQIKTTKKVTIPSTMEVIVDPEHGYLPGYMGYRGVAFFRTTFQTKQALVRPRPDSLTKRPPNGPAARIQFQACSFYCRVWLNGVQVGDHIGGGYVAWSLDVSDEMLELGHKHQLSESTDGKDAMLTHELFVLVDNRFNSTTAPLHTGGDFWHYGGIMRSVEWHDRPNLRTKTSFSNDTASTVSKRVRKRTLTEDNSFSKVWPWRLYVQPQVDMRSVDLSLQVVGSLEDCHRTNIDLLKELTQKNNIQIYFDGNSSENVLDDARLPLAIDIDSTEITDPITKRGNDLLVRLGTYPVPHPRIWSTADPQLHTVSVDLNGAIVTERFGLRFWDTGIASNKSQITTTNAIGRLRLNGNVLKLKGWNHHTQWPYTAASPTDEQLDQDIRLLKEFGHANFVRGAHYPQDPRWLDRLDEHGIVVWSETLGPSVSVENLQDDYFLKAQNQQINEMIDNAFNHASIAFWGFFNEGPSNHEEACDGYLASSKAIKSRDSSRFVTYASNRRPPADKCYAAATVISYNGYPGWYDDREPEDFWNSLASDLCSGKYPDAFGKPLLISETGAGGIYEWKHNETVWKWTLEYQTDIVSRDVANAMENNNISGIALWHFFDFKVNDKWENNTHCDYQPGVTPKTCGYIDVESSFRPGGANHKGSIDFFRRPKPVFSIVASQYEISDQ